MKPSLDGLCQAQRTASALDPRRAFEDVGRADVQWRLVALAIQEPGIQSGQRL